MKGPEWNKFLATRMSDRDIGVYQSVNSPYWPIPEPMRRIHFGFCDFETMYRFLEKNIDEEYELMVRGSHENWIRNYQFLSGLKNIKGLGGSNLTRKMFSNWKSLKSIFLGDNCGSFSAQDHPELVSLRGAFSAGDNRGVAGHPCLRSLWAAYSPSGRIKLESLGSMPALQHFGISYGGYVDLDFLEGANKITVLSLRGATRLTNLDGLISCPNLEFLWIENAKKLSDISAIYRLKKLRKVVCQNCSCEKEVDEVNRNIRNAWLMKHGG